MKQQHDSAPAYSTVMYVVPVWLLGVWDILWTEGCVCGSNESTVSHHSVCLPIPDAGAAECVDAQPEIIDNTKCT